MFGYINPDVPWLFKKDDVLYKAVYCGLCKGIAKGCGQCSRTALTYDMAFTSALVHNIRGEDVKIEKRRCVLHWFRRRPIAVADELTICLGCANTILAYYKLLDDKRDGDKRAFLRHFYRGGFKKAKKKYPEIAVAVEEQIAAQRAVEEKSSAIAEEAAEPTAVMMQKLSDLVLGEFASPATQRLFYALGKWIYLVDAVDDYDKDIKKGRYNVFYNVYRQNTKRELINKAGEELKFIFNSLFAEMRAGLSGIKFNFNHDLTDNIILRGIPLRSREVFYGREGAEKGVNNEQKES